jgi:transposase
MQRRYEILRASFLECLSAKEAAERFSCSVHTVNALRRDFKTGSLPLFFQPLTQGPKQRRSSTEGKRQRIIQLRKLSYSEIEIEEALAREQYEISLSTISRVLKEEGFGKLFRRTGVERKIALQQGKEQAEESDAELFAARRWVNTSYGGIFLFIPLIIDLDLPALFESTGFFGSKQIPSINYLMSFLALKLIGKERLSHVVDLNFDYGPADFAGLNVLPKCTSMTQYSYRNSRKLVVKLLTEWNKVLMKKGYLKGEHINCDFHTAPHWGEESQLEGHWVPTRGKNMKSVLSFFAQDLDTTYLCYSNAQLSRDDAADEILNFVSFYRKAHGKCPECLVFDSKLTTYKNLNVLDKDFHIKFISLRRRGKKLLQRIAKIRSWVKIKIDKPSRKYKALKIHEELVTLDGYEGKLRQIIVTGTGRKMPMLIVTNDLESSAKEMIATYALRGRIENNIQENVDFFSLNALSSPVIIKVDFDIAMTLIANTLYKAMGEKFKLFETAKAKSIYRSLIFGKARIRIKGGKVNVRFGKKAYNPMIMDWVKSLPKVKVPWMQNMFIEYEFE